MLKNSVLIFALLMALNTLTAIAQDVNVILKNSDIKQGALLGYNQQTIFLEKQGKVLEISMNEVEKVVDPDTNELVEMTPKEESREIIGEKPHKPFEVLNNINFQPLGLLIGITVIELEIQTTESTSLALRFINTGYPLLEFGKFPIRAYGAGLRYRFFFDNFFGQKGFSIGPLVEYAKDAEVASYWNAGLEFGFHFSWGNHINWVGMVSLDAAVESSKKQGQIETGFKPGLNVSFGIGF